MSKDKKNSILLLFFVFIFCLLVFTGKSYAIRKLTLQAETFVLPDFRSQLSSHSFSAIGVDGKNGNIALAGDQAWCEIPYRNGDLDLKSAFIAPTKGYRLKAVASGPGEIFVYDVQTKQIMGQKRKIQLPVAVINASGMTYHKGRIFLADAGKNIIYDLDLAGTMAKVRNRYPAHKGICGLASDGETLYSCSNSYIVEYNEKIKPVYLYNIDVAIEGITCTAGREIFAVAKDKNEIYRFRIRR